PGSGAATVSCSASRSPRPTRAATSGSWPAPAPPRTRSPTPSNPRWPRLASVSADVPGDRVMLAAVPTILITGAAGLIGSMLRPRLARPGRTLRLLDIAPLTAGPGEEAIAASVTDMDAMTAACRGADAVIHLAGIAGEASWESISELNIGGGYVAFEAARR